jgi:single-strand DNA-binding protein
MASVNKVFLMGNLTRDPELRYIPSGQAVTTLGLAVNNRYGKGEDAKEDVLFIDVTVWAKSAENCAEYLGKGSPVFVEGRLKFRTWEQDGQKRSKIDVTATSVQFLSGGSKSGGGKGSQNTGEENFSPPENDDEIPF